jgi:hypothetical protein
MPPAKPMPTPARREQLRLAQARLVARRREQGLLPLRVYAPREHHALIRAYAKSLQDLDT